jgi:cell division protein FtsZ
VSNFQFVQATKKVIFNLSIRRDDMFELMEISGQQAVIKVLGIGGGGGNAVDHMLSANLEGVEFINANTDSQALHRSGVSKVMQLGEGLTKGLGAGANPDVGRQAATEDRDKIAAALDGTDMIFLTAGMGGGTGTGAAPVVAHLAREKGILTVAVVTRPFNFEGKKRIAAADQGIKELGELVDSLIVIPNERILEVMGGKITLLEAFSKANEVLLNAVQGISELITRPGLINVDFADVRTVMSEMGMAMMGSATATGPDRAIEAARGAVFSPLLEEVDIHGAKGLLVNVSAGPDMELAEFAQVGEIVNEYASEDGTVVIGTVLDPAMEGELRVTMVATGIRNRAHTPQITLVKDGEVEDTVDTEVDYDQPTVIRRRPRTAGDLDTKGNAAVDMDYLDVPAFLRRQAD